MKIEKEYNVQKLANKLKGSIKTVYETKKSKESKGCCFGWHINGDKKCNLCVYERECMIEAKEREQCEELTKHAEA